MKVRPQYLHSAKICAISWRFRDETTRAKIVFDQLKDRTRRATITTSPGKMKKSQKLNYERQDRTCLS